MVYCPFCAYQGVIYKATINKSGKVIYICDECFTVWYTDEIKEENCVNYRKFRSDNGISNIQKDITREGRI
jgi:hypothetical protein